MWGQKIAENFTYRRLFCIFWKHVVCMYNNIFWSTVVIQQRHSCTNFI